MPPFQILSIYHFGVLLVLLALIICLLFLKGKFPQIIRIGLIGALILHQFVFYIWHFVNQSFILDLQLPLHICSFSLFLVTSGLLTNNSRLVKTTIFWSPISAFLAILLPDMNSPVFSFNFFEFFYSHTFIILGCVFIYTSSEFRLRLKFFDIFKSLGLLIVFSLMIIYPINLVLKSNYMYLMTPPKIGSLEIFPSFPSHIVYLIMVVFVVFSVEFILYSLTGKIITWLKTRGKSISA